MQWQCILTPDNPGAALGEAQLEHAACPDVPPDLPRVLEDDDPGVGDQAGPGEVTTPAGGHRPQARPALSPGPGLRLSLG